MGGAYAFTTVVLGPQSEALSLAAITLPKWVRQVCPYLVQTSSALFCPAAELLCKATDRWSPWNFHLVGMCLAKWAKETEKQWF